MWRQSFPTLGFRRLSTQLFSKFPWLPFVESQLCTRFRVRGVALTLLQTLPACIILIPVEDLRRRRLGTPKSLSIATACKWRAWTQAPAMRCGHPHPQLLLLARSHISPLLVRGPHCVLLCRTCVGLCLLSPVPAPAVVTLWSCMAPPLDCRQERPVLISVGSPAPRIRAYGLSDYE